MFGDRPAAAGAPAVRRPLSTGDTLVVGRTTLPVLRADGPARILVVGDADDLRFVLEIVFAPAVIRCVVDVDAHRGEGVDAVVVASTEPGADLVRVLHHPQLHATPVVVFAPGHTLARAHAHGAEVRSVTSVVDPVHDLIGCVRSMLVRASLRSGAELN